MSAAVPLDPSCPAAHVLGDDLTALDGAPVSGLTVSTGTTPEEFTGTVLGVLRDGIAPGRHMVLAELSSPEIDRVGGIWSGMSGSPVYLDDGTLLGAVAYGLSLGPSKVAGITPATDMYAVRDRVGTDATARTSVRLTSSQQEAAVASGAASSTEASSPVRRLPVPFGVSGLTASRLADSRLRSHLAVPGLRAVPVPVSAPGSAPTGGPDEQVVAGGNLAAGMSYGDISAVAVGTATAVCDGTVVGFGHPFTYAGATSLSLHGATAVRVQEDPTVAPFKLANPSAPVGTVSQDRLAAIAGLVGPTPSTVPVTSTVAPSDGRDGRTDVVLPDFLPTATAFQLLSDVDATMDRIGGGDVSLGLTVTGTRADGSPWTVERTDRVADPADVAFSSIFPVLDVVGRVAENPYEDVDITSVHVDASVSDAYSDLRLTKLEYRTPAGQWVPATGDQPVVAVAGDRLRLRATLLPYRSSTPVQLPVDVLVPAGSGGVVGSLTLVGGGFGGGGEGEGEGAAPVESFDGLLTELREAPRGDDLTATLELFPPGEPEGPPAPPTRSSTRVRADRVVLGELSVGVTVARPRPSRPAVVSRDLFALRGSMTSGSATRTLSLRPAGGIPVMGDWDGNGSATPGRFTDGSWRMVDDDPARTSSITFGQAGDLPVVGDFDGDGRDDIGVRRGSQFLLRYTAAGAARPTAGPPSATFAFGPSGGRPVAGDWDGDGVDTVGTVHSGRWRLADAQGAALPSFVYGLTTDQPVVGDWDRDGRTDIGVYRKGVWRLRYSADAGPGQLVVTFGDPAGTAVVWR